MVVTIKIILITCEHGDHLDPKAISVVEKEGTLLITNASSQEKLGKGQVMKKRGSSQTSWTLSNQIIPFISLRTGI